jgi:hypothetical protein
LSKSIDFKLFQIFSLLALVLSLLTNLPFDQLAVLTRSNLHKPNLALHYKDYLAESFLVSTGSVKVNRRLLKSFLCNWGFHLSN